MDPGQSNGKTITAEVVPPAPTSIEDVVSNLADLGLPAEMIQSAVKIPVKQVRSILSIRRTAAPSPQQEALADEVRSLTRLAIRKATTIIEFGPPEHRISLIRALISNAGRLVSQQEDSTTAELREEMTTLFAEMRDVPADPTPITDDSYIDIAPSNDEIPHALEIAAPPSSTDYQDDEYGVQKTGFELR